MRIIHLLRHAVHAEVGHVLSGRSDIALSDAGRTQAARVAGVLDDTPVARLCSSPRRRALQTAAPFAARRGLAVLQVEALDEVDFGTFSGRSFAQLAGDPAWQRWNAARGSARCPGGETMGEAVGRVKIWLGGLPDAAFPLLCVTHCDIIRGLVADLLGLRSLFAVECDPASRTTLSLEDEDVRLVALNVPAGL